ncbi:MAG: hypothetical protein H7A40_03290 [Chlamydiales bacterium]|nr:hypothetical protein [Chlamydiales bacterium]
MPIQQVNYAGAQSCRDGRSPNEDLEHAVSTCNWPVTLNLLQNYDFEAYPPSTLMYVVRSADDPTRRTLFERFFSNDRCPFNEDEISKALLVAAAGGHRDIMGRLMELSSFKDTPTERAKEFVDYIDKGPDWETTLLNCACCGLWRYARFIIENTGVFSKEASLELIAANSICHVLTEDGMEAAKKAAIDEKANAQNSEQRNNIETAIRVVQEGMILADWQQP